MAPATRGKRSADADPVSRPAKQPRTTRAQTVVDAKAKVKRELSDEADETAEPEVKKQPVRKGRSKANVKPEPVEDENEQADVVEPAKTKAAPKKGRAKAKADAGPTKDEQTDAAEADETKPAPKKGRGKVKVKQEQADDEQVDNVKPDEKKTKAAPPTEAKEAQVAKAGTSQIPLDDGCHLTSYHVYVDPADGLIYDAALNQTNASGNNNKFYRVQVGNSYVQPLVLITDSPS
jgi:poly [ADP-ribose] polymerase